MNTPLLSKQAFWDVDMSTIDYEKNMLFVMERVLKNGSYEDFNALKNYYGKNNWRNQIVNSKNLDTMNANFCCVVFQMKIEDFKHELKRYSYPSWNFSGA